MESKEPKSGLDRSIDDILKYRENLEKCAENTEDVKKGNCTAEDEKQEPGYLLYQAISESSIAILQQPTVVKLFETISKDVGEDLAKSLVELFAISMSNSAYNAITFYDQLLKGELTKQFDHYGDYLNATTATVKAHDGVLEVLNKRVSDIENNIKLREVKDQIKK